MNIPDKYRDRYDALAQEHPWMREMRDETNGIDGETNGIADGPPLVYELPDGDALDLMKNKGVRQILQALGIEHDCKKHMTKMLRVLADMVERDYVGRDGYDFVVDALKYMKAERDELQRKLEIADRHEFESDQACDECKEHTDELLAELTAERDEALEIRDKALGDAATFKSERDELTDKIGEITDEARELMKKQPYTFAVHDVPGSLRTVGRYIDELTAERDELKTMNEKLQVALDAVEGCDERCKRLEAERDEWKAEAARLKKEVAAYTNQAIRMYDDTKAQAELDVKNELRELKIKLDSWEYKYGKLEAERDEWKVKAEAKSAKRAVAVERLKQLDEFGGGSFEYAILGSDKMAWSYMDKRDALIDLLTDSPMDAHGTANGTCPDANRTASNDYGQTADMSRKNADCVRNDGFMSENDVRADDVDANDGSVTCNISGENVTDSREKLEVDVRKFVYSKGWFDDGIEPDSKPYIMELFIEWLNRQAAITKSECANTNAQRLGELHGLLDEAAREREKLREELAEWKHSHPLTLNQPDSKSVAPKPAETAENDAAKDDIRDFDDSREKLEADVRYRSIRPTMKIDCHYDDVLRWLDRQAAIEKRRFFDGIAEHQADNLKLQSRIRELESERERNRRQIDHLTAQCYEMDGLTATAKIRGLQRKVDSLTEQKDTLISYVEADGTRYSEVDGNQVFDHSDLASGDYHEEWHRVCVERDDLARTLGETMAEREMYRDLCGQMLDAMDDIRTKVDASFPRGGKEVM